VRTVRGVRSHRASGFFAAPCPLGLPRTGTGDRLHGVTVEKLQSVDAFVVIDLPGADSSDGIVRCARKVLVDSTRALARVRTYAWALLGEKVSGASAGINAVGEARDAAVAAFAAELAPRIAAGTLTLAPGKGLNDSELAGLGAVVPPDTVAFAAGVTASAGAATGGLDGRRVAIEFDAGAGEALTAALGAAGAEVVASGADALTTEADVLLFGSKVGVVDHHLAAELPHRVLVPTGDLAFTPRALAVASRRDITVLPDFLTTAGPLAARAGRDPGEALAALTAEVLAHAEGPVLGACIRAEAFLSTWVDELPFGRPIG